MSKLNFKSIYSSTEELLKKIKEPLVERKNKRVLEAAIDSALEQQFKAEESLQKELEVVIKGDAINFNNVLKYRQTIVDAEATVKELREFEKEFFTE